MCYTATHITDMLGTSRKNHFFKVYEEPHLRNIYAQHDPQIFTRLPYVMKVLTFRQHKAGQSKKSPPFLRKNVKVDMKCDKNFIHWGIHFSSETFERLQEKCVQTLERELQARNATYVEVGLGKFFNPSECIMLRVRIYAGESVSEQLFKTSELFMENIGQVRKYLLFPPPF